MKQCFLKTSIAIVVLLSWITGTAMADFYMVKEHDTFSQIAQRLIKGPVWGKNGSLDRLLSLNPKHRKNPHLILPGEEIQIPGTTEIRQITSRAVTSLPEPPKEMSKLFQQYSSFSIVPLFSFSRIDSTDNTNGSHATLGSQLNYGLELLWRQFWSETFQTGLSLNAKSESFTTTGSLPINNSSQTYGGLDAQVKSGREDSVQGLAHFGLEQRPFIRGASPGTNIIDSLAIPDIGVEAFIPLYQSNIFSLKLVPGIDYLVPVNTSMYNVQSGYGIEGKLILEQKSPDESDHRKLSAELFFRYESQNTTLTNQTVQEVGANLNFSFDFFQNAVRRPRREDEL